MWTYKQQPIRIPMLPTQPREWAISLPIPDGVEIGDHDAHDRMATELVPPGYMLVGTIPVSRRDSPRDAVALRDPQWWRIRVTYIPAAWQRELRAPVAVYAAAQVAGMETANDDVMAADYDGISYRMPTGRPTRRECYDWTRELPDDVRRALDEMRYIARRRTVGYMHGRPNTERARLVADRDETGDSRRYEEARDVVRGWVLATYPTVPTTK